MVAAGTGITVLPRTSIMPGQINENMIDIKPFEPPAPSRIVAIAWRKHYPRKAAIETIRDTIQTCPLNGVEIIH
jgi:LysR family hydrogen peroxide-inducible transcriptional activator